MTTFKNNAKYAELIFTYLELAAREDIPITVEDVLLTFPWRFKGGDLRAIASGTRLQPEVSSTVFPDGLSEEIALGGPNRVMWQALGQVVRNRIAGGRMRSRAVLARVSTYQMLTSHYGIVMSRPVIYTGMKSIYHLFGLVWEWALGVRSETETELLEAYTLELLTGTAVVSRMDIPTVDRRGKEYVSLLRESRLGGLLVAVRQVKSLIRTATGRLAMDLARREGRNERERWDATMMETGELLPMLTDQGEATRALSLRVGPARVRVSQGVAMVGTGERRWALSRSDMERLHQLLMSTASLIVGVCAQAATGTAAQKRSAALAVRVAERNVDRVVASSRKVPLGDEVLVCKGYRRAYTAFLGVLAGPMCGAETRILIDEAVDTAPTGVLDVAGFLTDAMSLDAASALNVSKVFKICPAPDVSPGGALADRVKTIGDGNVVDHGIMPEFEAELRAQILRALIRDGKGRLKLRDPSRVPIWHPQYLAKDFDRVPSDEISEYLVWEGSRDMPEVSQYDPGWWKDAGLGADSISEANRDGSLGKRGNMITRLLFDSECPMPGRNLLSDEHVIKFFVKAEGHKDPARGIFSANLMDRQAQSWMERAVDLVAKNHPSYMIGQEVDDRQAKVRQLTARPTDSGLVPLYYSFDISGWSAKMPKEPQTISHRVWGSIYGGHLFERAHEVNEGAHIYVNLDGYKGWFKNTHSNLEGFNGKEMTMVLVALLSLSVKRWRARVVEAEIMDQPSAQRVTALLFAYIDDGLSRIDLPRSIAAAAFEVYKSTVIETFARCGFSVEVSKCFPSDRFSIFLNEVYLAGRHVVHGVRAAMGISAEPTERHTSLVERVTSVATGVRGAVMAGLNPLAGVAVMAYHVLLHLEEWVDERDPVVLSGWSLCPRTWGGLGLPNMLQLYVSGSGAAFEESVATMQGYAKLNLSVKKAFTKLCRSSLVDRDAMGVMTAPLSGKVSQGYMVDSRIAVVVRDALQEKANDGLVSTYASRLLMYANTDAFSKYAQAIVAMDPEEVIQEQMLKNLADAHPHSVFSSFARRLEKSMTVMSIVGGDRFRRIIQLNNTEAISSVAMYRYRTH